MHPPRCWPTRLGHGSGLNHRPSPNQPSIQPTQISARPSRNPGTGGASGQCVGAASGRSTLDSPLHARDHPRSLHLPMPLHLPPPPGQPSSPTPPQPGNGNGGSSNTWLTSCSSARVPSQHLSGKRVPRRMPWSNRVSLENSFISNIYICNLFIISETDQRWVISMTGSCL